ncbi:MAG: hypothetical protein ACLPYB_01645 [Desulfobaccales bacterium]
MALPFLLPVYRELPANIANYRGGGKNSRYPPAAGGLNLCNARRVLIFAKNYA